MTTIIVSGAGDVGSAVAHRLFAARRRVVLHDDPKPAHARRGMAFADAFFDGRCELEGVVARRARDLEGLARMLACAGSLPVSDGELAALVAAVRPDVVVDARMRKHDRPACLLGLAPLTIGLGPGFEAGRHAHIVVETAWGADLGRVIASGGARPLGGEPRSIAGHARDRFVYATCEGEFETSFRIGGRVAAGDAVACIGSRFVLAPLSGILRGVTRSGASVRRGAKVLEVDPRGDPAAAFGIGERPARIAAGVLEALAPRRGVVGLAARPSAA